MAIATGTRFNHYEILVPLGAGGMGEVYRARDTRLNREVAIKVLPTDFARDAERLRRFEQEAHTTSALNHPNILTVYDIGTYDGSPYIVSELLAGADLRAQLQGSALPVRRVIDYAQQITQGLTAAHEKGIVHRDLKPENLFVTTDERVKILDFGLAKLKPQKPAGGVDAEAPTLRPLTDPGIILGTVGYMSPEQVRGQEADHRADIFSFGVTLYEMLSGRRTFAGDSAVELMNAILKDDPPELSETNAKVSPGLEKIVRRCLEKRTERRFQRSTDLTIALEALSKPSTSDAQRTEPLRALDTAALTKRAGWRERVAWIAAGLFALLAVTALVGVRAIRGQPEARAVRFTISAPEKTNFFGLTFVLSPDGRHLAFCAADINGKRQLYMRPLDSFTAQPLPGTEDAVFPFWSPDSRSIGFFSQGKLKRIELSGGPPQTLCDVKAAGGGSWNRAGEIILAQDDPGGPLYRVPATGGVLTALTALDQSHGETDHGLPQFLPDGQHFLCFVSSSQAVHEGIYVGSLTDKAQKLVLNTESNGVYASGHLLFVRNGALMGQAFNTSALELSGEPFLITDRILIGNFGVSFFSVSEDGVLAFRSATDGLPQLVWHDRSGKQLGTLGEPADYTNPSLSPDGKRLAVGIRDTQTKLRDIWLFDLMRGAKSRFTFDPKDDLNPVWSNDGSRIFFTSDRKGQRDLFQKKASSVEEEELIYTSPEPKNVGDLSPDGRSLLYSTSNYDLWLIPLEGERKPQPFIKTQHFEGQAAFSPDGRWVAYQSNESGVFEVYVTTFPQPSGKWQVSVGGGAEPQWRHDGQELFYVEGNRRIMAVEVRAGPGTFETGVPRFLFETSLIIGSYRNRYSVTRDGQRFLTITRPDVAAIPPINVVVNWTADLRR
jgi:Tol biopolymer transport system component